MSNLSIILDSSGKPSTSDFTTYFPAPIPLNGLQYNVGLSKLLLSYSWYNVSEALGNNTFRYSDGTTTPGPTGPTGPIPDVLVYKTVTIEDGVYSFTDLVDEIHDLMVLEGDYTEVDGENVFDINFELDISDGFTTMILTNSYAVDFTNRLIRTFFGFDSDEYTSTSLSESRSNVNNGVTSVHVHLSLINSSYVNGNLSDVIYTFAVTHQQNEVISIEVGNVKMLPINTRSQISSIRAYISDQNGNALNLQNQPMTLDLILEPITSY